LVYNDLIYDTPPFALFPDYHLLPVKKIKPKKKIILRLSEIGMEKSPLPNFNNLVIQKENALHTFVITFKTIIT